ncbi:glycosyltransferase [Flavobacterium lacus]|nr:glycosyltransferase [Flavobacterium lacus]
MQKVAIIIPCYNEAKRLNYNQIEQLLIKTASDIFFANDGSKDNTVEVIESIVKKHPERCFLIDFKENSGKANTIYKAINQINLEDKYDFIGYFDADFSTPASEIVRLINELSNQSCEFLFGSRILLLNSGIKRKYYRHIIGRIIITLINLKFKLGIYDTQCGAKLFSKTIIPKAFNKPFYTSWLFDVEIFIRLQKQNLLKQGIESPVFHWKDIEGSKLGWRTGFKILKEMYLLNKKY